jgi:hypothetical protein
LGVKGDGYGNSRGNGQGQGLTASFGRSNGGDNRTTGCGYGRGDGRGFTLLHFRYFSLGLLCLDPKDLKCLLIQSKIVVDSFNA